MGMISENGFTFNKLPLPGKAGYYQLFTDKQMTKE